MPLGGVQSQRHYQVFEFAVPKLVAPMWPRGWMEPDKLFRLVPWSHWDKDFYEVAGREGLFGSPGWIRPSDHSINSRMLYR